MSVSEASSPGAHSPARSAVPLDRFAQLQLSLRIALRELRSGLQGFYIFLSCLALGVAAIAAIGSFSKSIELGLSQQGRAILGGDLELRLVHRKLQSDRVTWLEKHTALSEVITLRAMVSNEENKSRALVELKAPANNYPLFGEFELKSGEDYRSTLDKKNNAWGLIADPALATRLNAKIGDTVKLGKLNFELRGLIKKEPDRVSGGFFFGSTRDDLKRSTCGNRTDSTWLTCVLALQTQTW